MTQTWIGTDTWDDQIGPRDQKCPHLSVESVEFIQHFHAVTAEARSQCPVAWDEARRRWFVTGAETLNEAAQNWQVFSSAYGVGGPHYPRLLPMDSDDPVHREWRRSMNALFTRPVMEAKRSEIRAIAEQLIDEFVADGKAELMARFCSPLPGEVFFQLIIDLPPDDLTHLQHIVEATTDNSDPEAQYAAARDLDAYVRRLVEERRAQPPTDDLIGRVVFAEIEGVPASLDDAVSVLTMVILGGLETTTNTLGGSLAHLAQDPELQERLRENPELVPAAVEEFLRLYGPTSYLTRYVTEDTQLAGISIKQGQRVALSFAAANRDPEVFGDPDDFRLDREHNRHYAFGIGPHRCMGSNLARLVLDEALKAVLARLREIQLAPGAVLAYRQAGVIALESVDVIFADAQDAAVTAY
jgi:cytochrome P450